MNNRKLYFIAALMLALAVSLAACMGSGTDSRNATPGATADYAPNATNDANSGMYDTNSGTANNLNGSAAGGTNNANGATGNTASTSNGALNAFDWANGAAEIEKAIGQLSEIAECRVVVTNSTALAGVKFDNVYKGEMTERIREMVAAEIMKADPSIQTVAVTSDEGDVAKVYAISDQIRAGRTADELSADINAIVRNATTLR